MVLLQIMSAETDLIPNYDFYQGFGALSRMAIAAAGSAWATGLENLRAVEGRPYILAPSHRAGIDPFVAGLTMLYLPELTADLPQGPLSSRPMHFMAKQELWKIPVVKHVIETCGAFPIERYKNLGIPDDKLSHMGNIVEANGIILIFPEGTRHVEDFDGVKREKMKSGVAYVAQRYGLPIVPAGIVGQDTGLKLPRFIDFNPPIWVPKAEHHDRRQIKLERREIMDELHIGINKSYQIALGHYLSHEPDLRYLARSQGNHSKTLDLAVGMFIAGALKQAIINR